MDASSWKKKIQEKPCAPFYFRWLIKCVTLLLNVYLFVYKTVSCLPTWIFRTSLKTAICDESILSKCYLFINRFTCTPLKHVKENNLIQSYVGSIQRNMNLFRNLLRFSFIVWKTCKSRLRAGMCLAPGSSLPTFILSCRTKQMSV